MRSNQLLYYTYKYLSLVIATGIFLILIDILLNAGEIYYDVILILVLLILTFFLIFIVVGKSLVQVEINENTIVVISMKKEYSWTDLSDIAFTWFGVYRMTDKNGNSYYFPPNDLDISFFGTKLNQDEFDELIERKKEQLSI